MKEDIREIEQKDLILYMEQHGEKAFKAKQVWEWMWQKGLDSFDEMTNLSKALREDLKKDFYFSPVVIKEEQVSVDHTRKISFELQDGMCVEGVLIPSKDRVTACISSQVGCVLGCGFCATARTRQRRDLTSGEIFGQVCALQKKSFEIYNKGLSNIVLMGMGEPLLNYDAVMRAMHFVSSPKGLGFSPGRITISSAGIIEGIKRLEKEKERYNLAISLHSTNDVKRSSLMPVNKSNTTSRLREALSTYAKNTGERITIEYLMLGNFNDTSSDAESLAKYCRAFPVKVNIIRYNPVPGLPYQTSSDEAVDKFTAYLESKNMLVHVRQSRGKDIDAACGQLAGKKV
jgi:23S rRNA (adenine2503-C2)-methyltransferase